MNGILGMLYLLEETALTEEQKEYMATIRDSADTLLATINDILDFSRLESGRLTIESVDFDLHSCH